MSYREKLDLGMTRQAVIEVLGEPDEIEKGEVSNEWKWETLVGCDGKESQAGISFTHGVATSLCFSSLNSSLLDFVISI